LLACGFIGAGMAVMAYYDRFFARPMMQQHWSLSTKTTTTVVHYDEMIDDVKVAQGDGDDDIIVSGIE
jgi:hypothetical protein